MSRLLFFPPAALAALVGLAGCFGQGGVQVERGSGSLPEQPESTQQEEAQNAEIVHVDLNDRLLTVRLNDQEDYRDAEILVTRDSVGQRTGVLRPVPRRSSSNLLETKILEGEPDINDTVKQAKDSVAKQLNEKHTAAAP